LLTAGERAKVQTAIDVLHGRRVDEPENRIAEILEVVRKFNKIENEGLLARMLEQQLYGKTQSTIKEGDRMLTDMLDVNRIKVGVKINNKIDAIRKAGQLLVDNDMAEPAYTDAMLQLMQELGNYIVIAPGVAMPHARADAGAKKTGFAIIVPQSPVEFGHPKNDPVRIILALTAIDNKSHLQAMRELSLLMAKEDVFNEVIESKSAEELLHRISEFEKTLANKIRQKGAV